MNTAQRGNMSATYRELAGALLFVGFLCSTNAAGVEQAPRRPPQPFSVFVESSDPAEAELKGLLEEALPVVRDRVRRRDDWLALARTRETADLVLRLTNYRIAQLMRPRLEQLILDGRVIMVERSEVLEVHYIDAVVAAGELRETMTGLDERERGASIRNAASHLAEQVEEFCRENYAALRGS